jgi:hypothetical protein
MHCLDPLEHRVITIQAMPLSTFQKNSDLTAFARLAPSSSQYRAFTAGAPRMVSTETTDRKGQNTTDVSQGYVAARDTPVAGRPRRPRPNKLSVAGTQNSPQANTRRSSAPGQAQSGTLPSTSFSSMAEAFASIKPPTWTPPADDSVPATEPELQPYVKQIFHGMVDMSQLRDKLSNKIVQQRWLDKDWKETQHQGAVLTNDYYERGRLEYLAWKIAVSSHTLHDLYTTDIFPDHLSAITSAWSWCHRLSRPLRPEAILRV